MITTIGGKRKRRGLLTWLVAAPILMIGIPANLRIPAIAAPTPEQPPIRGAIRILTIGPDNSTGAAGVMGGVGQPWLSDHEVLHFRQGSLYRYDVAAKSDTPLAQLTNQVKTSHCSIYFLDASPNGQQVIWGMSGNNPLFVATVDGTRREQWDGDGAMTKPFWCADGTHWLQCHFSITSLSLHLTKIEMHSLDAPQTSETFSCPPGLNGLDILAAPSADTIIARIPDPVAFQKPKLSKRTKHTDLNVAFDFIEIQTLRKHQAISVWSLRQAAPLHRYAIDLPGNVQEITVSSDGEHAVWLLSNGNGNVGTASLWVSKLDGSGLNEVGEFMLKEKAAHGLGMNLPSQLVWVPGNKQVSFVYGDALWAVAAQ